MVLIQTSMNPDTEATTPLKIRSSLNPSYGPFTNQLPKNTAVGTKTDTVMVNHRNPLLKLKGRREATTKVMDSNRASAKGDLPAVGPPSGAVQRSELPVEGEEAHQEQGVSPKAGTAPPVHYRGSRALTIARFSQGSGGMWERCWIPSLKNS